MQRNFRATAKPPEPKDDLLIMKKTREMIAYGHDCLYNKQFPRNQRIGNAIGAQIEKSMYEILEGLSDAAKKEHKKTALTQVDAKIYNLRQRRRNRLKRQRRTKLPLKHLQSVERQQERRQRQKQRASCRYSLLKETCIKCFMQRNQQRQPRKSC